VPLHLFLSYGPTVQDLVFRWWIKCLSCNLIIKTISFIASFAINFFAIIHHFNLFTGMSKECCALNLHIFSHKSIWSYGVFLLWHANIELMGVTKENNLSLPIHKHLEWLVCTLLRQVLLQRNWWRMMQWKKLSWWFGCNLYQVYVITNKIYWQHI
jgi:magnesium-transporting ATPase (P-type)